MGRLPKLSVTIAAKNESAQLRQCLSSVAFADEIVLVDDCSSDDTTEKARRFGARVIVRDSKGSFHKNKNIAIEEAKGEWILSLDADEIVSKQLAHSIESALILAQSDGFLVDRHNYFLGKWIKGCGWHPDYILRLFRKGKAWWPLEIHDVPKLEGDNLSAPLLKGPLIHNSYNSLEQYFGKFNQYTTRLAVEYAEQEQSMRGFGIPLNLGFRPFYWFFKKYFFLRGFRDGIPGFFICFSSALTIFVSYLKLWEAQEIDKIPKRPSRDARTNDGHV
jgi:glycosyltransferase involved in cell wall biosynthesis